MPLGNSFWLDETTIAWIVKNGFTNIVANTPVSVASIAFCWVEWCFGRVFGLNEVALRLPSVLAGIASLYVLYRLGAEFIDRETGFIFIGFYLSLPHVAFETPDARPYSLGIWAATVAVLWLLRWLRSASIKAGLLWVVCSVIACYMHDLFVMPLAIEGAFVVWIALRRTSIPVRQVFGVELLGVVMLLPALPRALALAQQAGQLGFLEVPKLADLLPLILPVYMLAPAVLIALLMAIEGQVLHWTGVKPNAKAAILGALILFIPAFGLFAISRLTSIRLFADRYLTPAVPGFVLLWGLLLRAIEPRSFRRLSVASGLIVSVILIGGFSAVPKYRIEDWRSAVRSIPDAGAALVYSGYVETRRLDWLQQREWWFRLMAPILTYRSSMTPENAFLMPFEFGSTEQAYVRRLMEGPLRDRDTVTVIVRRVFWGPAWLPWISEDLSGRGFRSVSDVRYGSVEVAVFHRSAAR
ncbi:MAG: glycosyltransferase family 39 protein [Acidobacteriia bacterium]|nr:glycosyltransferase family 39 protein [Terriglobia bacterium]